MLRNLQKSHLVEVGCGDVDWIGLARDRDRWRALVGLVLNLRVPQNAGKLSSVQTTGGLSSGARLHEVSYIPLSDTFFPALIGPFCSHTPTIP
jgi:hypothetical protein